MHSLVQLTTGNVSVVKYDEEEAFQRGLLYHLIK